MKKIYHPEISFIRGIACLLVIVTHVTLSYPFEKIDNIFILNFTLNQLARVGTPIFALISGFLLFSSKKNKQMKYNTFINLRVKKLLIPYLFWTIIYLLISQVINHNITLNRFWRYIFLGESYPHMYFLLMVIQFYILFPFINNTIHKNNINSLTIYSIILTALWYYFREFDFIHTLNFRAFILNWLAYFFMGGFLSYNILKIKIFLKKNYGLIYFLIIISVMGIIIEMNLPYLFQSDRFMNLIYVPIFTLFFMQLYSLSNMWIINLFTYVGDRSMGFYLVHLIVIGSYSNLLPQSFWNPKCLLLNYIFTVFGTALFVKMFLLIPGSQKLMPVSIHSNFLQKPNYDK